MSNSLDSWIFFSYHHILKTHYLLKEIHRDKLTCTFLIYAAIAQNFNSTVELGKSIRIPTK